MESPNKKLIQAWLDLQCSMVHGVGRGAVLVGDAGTSACDPIAVWPAQSMVTAPMLTAASRAMADQRQVVEAVALAAGTDIAPGYDIIAAPLVVEGRTIGAVALELTARGKSKQNAALQVLAWGAAWLTLLVDHLNNGPHLHLSIVIETIAEAIKHHEFDAAAASVANAFSRLLECSRVSIGFKDGTDVAVAAISNTARFEQRTNLVRAVAAAMGEAMDQDRVIAVPSKQHEAMVITRVHEQLRAEFGSKEILTLPFSNDDEIVGAVVLERNDDQTLNAQDLTLGETIASIIGPILYTKRCAQMPWPRRFYRSLAAELRRFTEAGHLTFKAGVLSLISLLLLATFVHVEHRVKADAVLRGRTQLAVIAPFDGYVAEAPVRAGDMVAKGLLMARLEDRDLMLERAKWSGERAQLTKARREALAKHDRAELNILQAKLDQANANLALAQEKLARTRVTAPLNGIVVSGDLSQSIGAPVKRGDLLYEVAPLDEYRIVLQVDERDVAHVQVGATGQLALSSLPHLKHPFTVDRIVPGSTAENGGNFFTVEARLDHNALHLRPGMAGIGKIDTGQRALIWIWTHKLSDWLRLLLWKWWG